MRVADTEGAGSALAGRTAVVTGAGGGVGAGIARALAAQGAAVAVAELDRDAGQRVVDELTAAGADAVLVPTDVSDRGQVEAMVDAALTRWGRIDVLVNNAWHGAEVGRVEHKTDQQLATALDVGFYGAFWAMRAAAPAMRNQAYGRVINLCSLNGVNAHMGTLEYNTAKEALRTLTRTAAREWAPAGITVNAICPAARSAAFERVMANSPELAAAAEASNPMGRMGDPEADIGPVAVFLAGEGSGYLTGNTLFVDGGAHISGVPWNPDLDGDGQGSGG